MPYERGGTPPPLWAQRGPWAPILRGLTTLYIVIAVAAVTLIIAPIRSGLVDACRGEPRVRGLHGPLGFCRASRAFSAVFYARARLAGPTV